VENYLVDDEPEDRAVRMTMEPRLASSIS
jgi:hypothetical protein